MPTKKSAAPTRKSAARKADASEALPVDDGSVAAADRLVVERAEDSVGGAEAPTSSPKRAAPPVRLPASVLRSSSSPTASIRELQVGLRDLGFYEGKVDGFYSQRLRNAVSKFQVALRDSGHYSGLPGGVWNAATHEAAIASPAFNVE